MCEKQSILWIKLKYRKVYLNRKVDFRIQLSGLFRLKLIPYILLKNI